LCSGWLACHNPQELLALRFPGRVDPSAYTYTTDVALFASGAEARAHGIRDVRAPGAKAQKMMRGIVRGRGPKKQRDHKL